MVRLIAILVCLLGGWVLVAGVVAPLVGMVIAGSQQNGVLTDPLVVRSAWGLLVRSLLLSAIATLGAIVLGLWPAAVLGSAHGRALAVVVGLVLTGLLVPPQIYAYAWELASGPTGLLGFLLPAASTDQSTGSVVRAGLISAAWLWPVVAFILGAGWRTTGRASYTMAVLDTTPARAYLYAVVPSMRNHLVAAASLVFAICLIEYAIPHMTLARVYATELMLLVDAGAPYGQTVRMAGHVIALVLILMLVAAWSVRSTAQWQPVTDDDASLQCSHGTRANLLGAGWEALCAAAGVWFVTVALPVIVMLASLRRPKAWFEALTLFAREWRVSLAVSLAAGVMAVALAVVTVLLGHASGRRFLRGGALLSVLAAVTPPAALGIGFIVVFNRGGFLGDCYDRSPVVWCLALAARYGAIAILILWLAIGRRSMVVLEQARSDGAGSMDVLAFVLLPMFAPAMLAAGLIVTLLSLFEVVVTQLVGPVGYPSLALTILNHMHYGRDDVVIMTSLILMGAGLLVTVACGVLLVRPRQVAAAIMLVALAGCGSEELTAGRPDQVFGEQGLGPGQFVYPRALAIAPDGCVFVVDKSARIQRFSPQGEFEVGWRMPEWQGGKPTGLTVDRQGRVLVADTHYHRVVVFDRDGHELNRFGGEGEQLGQFVFPTAVAVDREGYLYVSEYGGNDRITRFTPDFKAVGAFGGPSSGEAALLRPEAMAFDAEGTLWVADACHHRICRFTWTGEWKGSFGCAGRQRGQLEYPYDIAVAADGTLLVCEFGNNRLQRFDRQGRSLGTWGEAGRKPGQLAYPWGAAIGPNQWIYVVDAGNNRVQVLKK